MQHHKIHHSILEVYNALLARYLFDQKKKKTFTSHADSRLKCSHQANDRLSTNSQHSTDCDTISAGKNILNNLVQLSVIATYQNGEERNHGGFSDDCQDISQNIREIINDDPTLQIHIPDAQGKLPSVVLHYGVDRASNAHEDSLNDSGKLSSISEKTPHNICPPDLDYQKVVSDKNQIDENGFQFQNKNDIVVTNIFQKDIQFRENSQDTCIKEVDVMQNVTNVLDIPNDIQVNDINMCLVTRVNTDLDKINDIANSKVENEDVDLSQMLATQKVNCYKSCNCDLVKEENGVASSHRLESHDRDGTENLDKQSADVIETKTLDIETLELESNEESLGNRFRLHTPSDVTVRNIENEDNCGLLNGVPLNGQSNHSDLDSNKMDNDRMTGEDIMNATDDERKLGECSVMFLKDNKHGILVQETEDELSAMNDVVTQNFTPVIASDKTNNPTVHEEHEISFKEDTTFNRTGNQCCSTPKDRVEGGSDKASVENSSVHSVLALPQVSYHEKVSKMTDSTYDIELQNDPSKENGIFSTLISTPKNNESSFMLDVDCCLPNNKLPFTITGNSFMERSKEEDISANLNMENGEKVHYDRVSENVNKAGFNFTVLNSGESSDLFSDKLQEHDNLISIIDVNCQVDDTYKNYILQKNSFLDSEIQKNKLDNYCSEVNDRNRNTLNIYGHSNSRFSLEKIVEEPSCFEEDFRDEFQSNETQISVSPSRIIIPKIVITSGDDAEEIINKSSSNELEISNSTQIETSYSQPQTNIELFQNNISKHLRGLPSTGSNTDSIEESVRMAAGKLSKEITDQKRDFDLSLGLEYYQNLLSTSQLDPENESIQTSDFLQISKELNRGDLGEHENELSSHFSSSNKVHIGNVENKEKLITNDVQIPVPNNSIRKTTDCWFSDSEHTSTGNETDVERKRPKHVVKKGAKRKKGKCHEKETARVLEHMQMLLGRMEKAPIQLKMWGGSM